MNVIFICINFYILLFFTIIVYLLYYIIHVGETTRQNIYDKLKAILACCNL